MGFAGSTHISFGQGKVELQAKGPQSRGGKEENGKAKLQARLEYLRKKRDYAFSKIQKVKNTSEDAWHDLKQGTENVVNSLKHVIAKIKAGFKKRKKNDSPGKELTN